MKLLLSIKVYIAVIILAGFSACKKECDSTYTITGQILNGTTNEPYADTNISGYVYEKKNFGGSNSAQLFRSRTDSEGKFTVTYDCTDINSDIQFLLGNHEAFLPRNQNITDKTIYFSPEGSFDVYVKLKEPLLPNDTLFVATPLDTDLFNDSMRIDTFINPKEGFFKNIRVPNTSFNIFWGRSTPLGAGKFNYIKQANGFDKDTPREYVNPSGDPYIDKLELEF